MPSEANQLHPTSLDAIYNLVNVPFWDRGDFWVGVVLGVVGISVAVAGLIYSFKAFEEAKRATRAAKEAGRTVKMQTTAVELSEVTHRPGKIQPEIRFNDARELINEISYRLRRSIAPFESDPALNGPISALLDLLGVAKDALGSVQPTGQGETPNSVYYAVQAQFGAVSDAVASLNRIV
jgi:hypothetical protein